MNIPAKIIETLPVKIKNFSLSSIPGIRAIIEHLSDKFQMKF